jgi:DNA-binding transcriptional regulator YiaG
MKKSITEVIHETIKGLYDIKAVDAKTMKKYDRLCLPEIQKLKAKPSNNCAASCITLHASRQLKNST